MLDRAPGSIRSAIVAAMIIAILSSTPVTAAVARSDARLPGSLLHFEPAEKPGAFVASGRGVAFTIEGNETQVTLVAGGRKGTTTIRLRLLGARPASVEASEPLVGRSHSYRGALPSAWRLNVPHFGRVSAQEVYSGIDVTHYVREGVLEQDFVVHPGADPGQIRLAVEGGASLRMDAAGDLALATSEGESELRIGAPSAYQLTNGRRHVVGCAFVLGDDRQVTLRLDPYDRSRPLVIDPVLTVVRLLGGTGAETGMDVIVDTDGTLWASGMTTSPAGDTEAFVAHLTPDARRLLSMTTLGGTGEEFGNRLRATASSVYLVGSTISADFPSSECDVCRNPPAGLESWQIWDPASDSQNYLVRLDKSGALQKAVVFGGERLDHAWVLDIDDEGRILVGGTSCGDGFPVSDDALQPTRNGGDGSAPDAGCDVTVTRFSGRRLIHRYGTYFGGSRADYVAGLAAAPSGQVWVVGGTTSTDFPVAGSRAQATIGGGTDAFVTRFSPNAAALLFSSYLGGEGYDYAFEVKLGPQLEAYVTGRTESQDFPTTPGAFQRRLAGGSDGFATKFRRQRMEWSTLLGGSDVDWPFALEVDETGSAYVAGFTGSLDFPRLLSSQLTHGGGGADAFVTKLTSRGNGLRWSTLLGGAGWDQAHGLALTRRGVWTIGTTPGGLPGPVSSPASGTSDALLAFFDFRPVR